MGPVVLCIDNRKINLEAEQQLLESRGFGVLTATNCTDAMKILRSLKVDVALVSDDLHHSELITCARVRELCPEVAIVLQRTSFTIPDTPEQIDLIIPKTMHPEQKLQLLKSLQIRRAA